MEPQCFVPEASNDFRTKEEVKSIEVRLNEIPEFLRSGGYYRSFWEDVMRECDQLDAEAQAIMVPEICFRATTSVSDANDLHHLLSTLRFWVVDVLPDSVISYALNNDTAHSFSTVTEPFMNDMPKLKVLQTIRCIKDRSRRLITAMNETSCEEIVEYLFKHKKDESPLSERVASTAAALGNIKYLQYAHEHGCSWDASTNIKAAAGGHLDCMKYAHEHGCPFDFRPISHRNGVCTLTAACSGHLNCLQYAHQHGASLYSHYENNVGISYDALRSSASGGHIDCMQYALNNGCSCDEITMMLAVTSGKLECVKYLRELDCEWDEDVFEVAVKNGQLDMVVFLHKQGCPWTTKACTKAAEAGHLDCLQYLHEQGCPLNEEVCTAAAEAGHLDCLQYLHEQGCPWNEEVCTAAAEAGHLDCFQYLHEQGCPWDERTTLAAAIEGRASCLEYAISEGCPVQQDICSEMFALQPSESCTTGSRIHCLKYLHYLGYAVGGAATKATRNARDTDCVEYIASIRKRGRAVLQQYP